MPKIKSIPLLETFFKNKGKTTELWKTINELLNTRENEIPVFCTYIKHKINGYDKQNSLLALDFIDFCVDYGNMNLWSQLNSKDFLSSLITNLKTREDTEIQSKILFLIEKWAKKFEKFYPELSNFQKIYLLLKNKNVAFPINMQSDYNKYIKYIHIINNNSVNNDYCSKNYNDNNINNNGYFDKNYNENNNINKKQTDPETYLRDINLDLNTSSYDKKYKRLVNKLYDWTHDIHEINVLINKNNGGINNNKISGLIKDLSSGKGQLIETIQSGKLKDETLMNISLNVSSDIEMTLRRWSNHKKSIYPNPFISSFLINKNNSQNNDNNSYYEAPNYNSYNENIYNKNKNIDLKDFYNINNSTTIINKNKNIDLKDFYNINNSTTIINKNMNMNNNINYNNTFENNKNQNSFNLLVDFDCAPASNNNNFNNNSLNINNKNFSGFLSETEKNNNLDNKTKNNASFKNNNFNDLNSNTQDKNFNYMNNMVNLNNNLNIDDLFNDNNNNLEKNDFEINNVDVTRQSIMYPSFEELNQS